MKEENQMEMGREGKKKNGNNKEREQIKQSDKTFKYNLKTLQIMLTDRMLHTSKLYV